MPSSDKQAPDAVEGGGALLDESLAARCTINWPCCSMVLRGTQRIWSLVTASLMVAASAASLLLRRPQLVSLIPPAYRSHDRYLCNNADCRQTIQQQNSRADLVDLCNLM